MTDDLALLEPPVKAIAATRPAVERAVDKNEQDEPLEVFASPVLDPIRASY